jgi:hypothetical protein
MLMQQLLQLLKLLRASRACAAACVIDTMYHAADLQLGADPGVEKRIFVIWLL